MKKQIFFFLLVIFSEITFGQTLIETNKIWNVITFINYGPSFTVSYKFEGDSVIDDLTYKKLWRTDDSTYSTWYYESIFREDPTGKVFRHTIQGEELFYDFGLSINDVFNGSIYGCPVELTLDSIDMVTLENGEIRKRMIFNYSSYYWEDWIEGIGSLLGLINVGCEQCGADIWNELNCFTENDTLKYDNPNYDPCYYTTVGINEAKPYQKLLAVPNPFKDQFKLTYNHNENIEYEIRLLSSQGIVLNKYFQVNSGELYIPGEFLNKGLYFIQLYENGKLRLTKKILKI